MLVACQLVNRTTWRAAAPVHAALRRRWPDVRLLESAGGGLEALLRPLGLWRRRAATLRRFASAFASGPPRTAADVAALPGCGAYAADSWAIFVDGALPDCPSDRYLSAYVEWRRRACVLQRV